MYCGFYAEYLWSGKDTEVQISIFTNDSQGLTLAGLMVATLASLLVF
jgi:hypothetical protein